MTAAGGWVVNHALQSNIALAVSFTLPAGNLGLLRDGLLQAGLNLDADGLAGLNGLSGGDGKASVALNVTFVHDDPDLRHDVPAVPD